MSPLPMTGIVRTASTTRRMPARFTEPSKPCCRVRPCTMIAATPASSSARARSGAVRFSSSQPRRILQVIGIRTASIIPRTSAAVRPSSVIMAEPPPTPQTFLTGQPMLTSTEATPRSSSIRVGVAISRRHGAENLHGEGRVLRASLDQLQRLAVLLQQRARVHQVGRAQPHAAESRGSPGEKADWYIRPGAIKGEAWPAAVFQKRRRPCDGTALYPKTARSESFVTAAGPAGHSSVKVVVDPIEMTADEAAACVARARQGDEKGGPRPLPLHVSARRQAGLRESPRQGGVEDLIQQICIKVITNLHKYSGPGAVPALGLAHHGQHLPQPDPARKGAARGAPGRPERGRGARDRVARRLARRARCVGPGRRPANWSRNCCAGLRPRTGC